MLHLKCLIYIGLIVPASLALARDIELSQRPCDRMRPDLKELYNKYRSDLDSTVQSVSLQYQQSATDNMKQCYKVNDLSALSRNLSSLNFSGSDSLDASSNQKLDSIADDILRQYHDLPPAQQKLGLDLNIMGHTGYWSHENFFHNLLEKDSTAHKQIAYLTKTGKIPSDFPDKVKAFQDKCSGRPYHEFTDDEFDQLENIQKLYFQALSQQRAEKICQLLEPKVSSVKVRCLPKGKGTTESLVNYNQYLHMNNKKQGEANQILRRVTANLSVAAVKDIELDGKEQIQLNDVYYSRTRSTSLKNIKNATMLTDKAEFKNLLKKHYPDGKFDHCLMKGGESEHYSNDKESLTIRTSFGEVQIENFRHKAENEQLETQSVFPLNFLDAPHDNITELYALNGKYHVKDGFNTREISLDEYQQLQKSLHEKIPDLESILQAARKHAVNEFYKADNSGVEALSVREDEQILALGNEAEKINEKLLSKNRFCDGFEKYLGQVKSPLEGVSNQGRTISKEPSTEQSLSGKSSQSASQQ